MYFFLVDIVILLVDIYIYIYSHIRALTNYQNVRWDTWIELIDDGWLMIMFDFILPNILGIITIYWGNPVLNQPVQRNGTKFWTLSWNIVWLIGKYKDFYYRPNLLWNLGRENYQPTSKMRWDCMVLMAHFLENSSQQMGEFTNNMLSNALTLLELWECDDPVSPHRSP